jgi:1-acyl-sn-glycerol-3-phosphate acyltransferase
MVRNIVFVLVWVFFKLFYRNKVYGRENLPKGGGIIASNHVSFYDPPLIGISCVEKVHFLARESLFQSRIFGWLLKQLGTHPVARGKTNTQTFKKAYELITSGQKVVIFPEGKRNVEGKIGKGLPGIGMLVLRSKAIVVPTYVHGTFEVWNNKRKFPKLWGKALVCVFGKPLDFSFLQDLSDKKEAQKEIVDTIMETIQALRDWYLAGAKGTPP